MRFSELKEEIRMAGLLNDLRYAVRGLLRHPAFTIVAVVTLALGIGANTAVFTLVDGVLVRPLPYPEPQELLAIEHQGREGQDELPISDGLYLLYGEQASSLRVHRHVRRLGDQPDGRRRAGTGPRSVCHTEFLEVLEVPPADGRGFLPEEERPGADPVVVISHGFWQRAFGGDPVGSWANAGYEWGGVGGL